MFLKDQFIYEQQIGDGATSIVYLENINGTQVAVKKAKYEVDFSKEIKILQKIPKHTNLINLLEYNKEHTKITMDFAENLELFAYVKKGGFGETFGRIIAKQVGEAIEAIHSKGIVHRDIKLENILLDKNFTCLLTDFGFATEENISTEYSVGTESYKSPEIREKRQYFTKPSDIFTLGIIFFIIVTGIVPFHKSSPSDFFYKLIYNKNYERYWELISKTNKISVSEDCKKLLNFMFEYDFKLRPTIEEVLKHPWFSNNEITEKDKKNLYEEFNKRKKTILKI